MAGAYVAKPAGPIVSNKPTGWGSWPFPGPLPPGYGMDLSLNLTSGATYLPGADHDATVSLRDREDYGTTEPDGPNEITWTATLDGADIQLKLSGGDYLWSIESDYADIGDFWGAEPTFVFPVTGDDADKVIVLTASSVNPFIGYVVENTSVSITVIGPPAYAIFSVTMTGRDTPFQRHPPGGLWDSAAYGTNIYFGNSAGYGQAPYVQCNLVHNSGTQPYNGTSESWVFSYDPATSTDFGMHYPVCTPEAGGYDPDFPYRIGECAEGEQIIRLITIRSYYPYPWSGALIYYLRHKDYAYGDDGTYIGEATWNFFFRVYTAGGTLIEEHTKVRTGGTFDNFLTWLTFNGATGEVIEVNP